MKFHRERAMSSTGLNKERALRADGSADSSSTTSGPLLGFCARPSCECDTGQNASSFPSFPNIRCEKIKNAFKKGVGFSSSSFAASR